MITFKCSNCNYSFSEANKAWDVAMSTGYCPNCKKVDTMFNSEGRLKPTTKLEPLGNLGNIFSALVTILLSACITILGVSLVGILGFVLFGHFGLMLFTLGASVIFLIIFPFLYLKIHPYISKYFRRIKSEGIFL